MKVFQQSIETDPSLNSLPLHVQIIVFESVPNSSPSSLSFFIWFGVQASNSASTSSAANLKSLAVALPTPYFSFTGKCNGLSG
ncbi:hypothetical protein HK096_000474 [Nowakowskiella sp. JEL0078]|nr:hypothetical protein HK096_000474 [Nowakowskiella sp. JEL0078]